MARRWTAGAEFGLGTAQWDGEVASGTVTRDTGTVRSGAGSYKCDSAAGAAAFFIAPLTPAASVTTFIRIYINTAATPTADTIIIQPFGTDTQASIKMKTDGTLILIVNNTQQGSASAAVNDGSWHRVEMSVTCSATNITAAELQVDGVSVATSATSIAVSFGTLFIGWKTSPGASKILYIDDCAMNDSSGAAQTSWPGSGKVVLLLPTSDNARGTGWTTDAAGTTNFFAATDNVPPTGVTDTTAGTGTHQIRNATANANSSVDLNMTTYTAAGIGGSDTINVVTPLVNTSAPVSTSAKAGTIGLVSNPTIANIALAAGGTTGAFWGGSAAGTWATGWGKWSPGTPTYAPSVTLGTAPVLRITQVTSSTRIAMVDAAGIYVDYTPPSSSVYTKAGYGKESG